MEALTVANELPEEFQRALEAPIPELRSASRYRVEANVIHLRRPRATLNRAYASTKEVAIEGGIAVAILCGLVFVAGGGMRDAILAGGGLSGGIALGRYLCHALP